MRRLLLIMALVLSACASSSEPQPAPEVQSELTTPGMIPFQCESLLQKSQDWGYHPAKAGIWRPKSVEQALEVAEFFVQFSLTPGPSSIALRSWMGEPESKSEEAAKAKMEDFQQIQFCDAPLAMIFLQGLLEFPWKNREQKQDVGNALLRFLVNQQARMTTLLPIAVTLQVTERAKQKGFIVGSSAPIRALREDLNKFRTRSQQFELSERGQGPITYLLQEKLLRNDINYTEELREKLAKHLPLP